MHVSNRAAVVREGLFKFAAKRRDVGDTESSQNGLVVERLMLDEFTPAVAELAPRVHPCVPDLSMNRCCS